MPKTLLVTNDFPPRIGGIESFVADLCGFLDDDVVVLTSRAAGAAAHDATLPYEVVRHSRVLLPTPATAGRAEALLRSRGADRVVFGAAAPLGLLAPRLRRAGADRIVGITHGHEVWWSRVPGARGALRRIGDECDQLTYISAFTAGHLRRVLSPLAGGRLTFLPPPVDPTAFAPEPRTDRDRPRCVAVGRLVRRKGFAHLLRAWQLVHRELGGAELVVVGDGPRRRSLHRLRKRLALESSVRFTGALRRPQVVAELQRADVFVLPVVTQRAGLDAEGLGLAAVEAAACGLPVVVGRSGGAPETVRDGVSGVVVDPNDADALAAAIAGLLADPDRAAAMGAAGREHVNRYGAEPARRTIRALLALD